MLHLGLHIEGDGPHTLCNHVRKLKNVAEGGLTSAGLGTLGVSYKTT
jgi:hypothetical protein